MTSDVFALVRLGTLRWLNMLAYSATYVVIPAVIFHGTRSAVLAGTAFIVEGVIRSVLALWSANFYARLGSRRALVLAEISRAIALLALASALHTFALPVVIFASVMFQFGFSIVALEQELRCTELGERAVKGQTVFRFAEVAAMPIVLALAVGVREPERQLVSLVCLAAMCLAGHKRNNL